MELMTLAQAREHIRHCRSCRAGEPCAEALVTLYGGGLVEVTDPGRLPAAPGRATDR